MAGKQSFNIPSEEVLAFISDVLSSVRRGPDLIGDRCRICNAGYKDEVVDTGYWVVKYRDGGLGGLTGCPDACELFNQRRSEADVCDAHLQHSRDRRYRQGEVLPACEPVVEQVGVAVLDV